MGLDGLNWVSIGKNNDFHGLDGLNWVSIGKNNDVHGFRWIEMGFNMENI